MTARHVLAAAVLAILTACDMEPARFLNRLYPMAGQQMFERDLYECRRANTHYASAMMFGQFSSGPVVDENMAMACLGARGWVRSN